MDDDGWMTCRWPMPFRESLVFDMELLHWQATRIDYATTSYWYAFPGARDHAPATLEQVRAPVGELGPR